MTCVLDEYLTDLETRIDPAVEDAVEAEWTVFLEDRCESDVFRPSPRPASPPKVEWPEININDTAEDMDLMVLDQFALVSQILAEGSSARLGVRCNYGTGLLPSLFGCEVFVMPREMNTLSTAKPLGSRDKLKALSAAGSPPLESGLGENVFRCRRRFQEVFDRYPKIARYVELYHPDMQGPIDILEMVWGCDMFLGFHDCPDLLRDMLELVTETYIRFMRAWCELVPPVSCPVHWTIALKGSVMLRNDSLMNLSPETYVQFVRPMDQKIFDECGGGAIHFCGRGDHYIEAMSEMSGLSAIQLSQPHLNDMETIYRNTVDKGIKLLAFEGDYADKAGRPLRGQVHCV